MSKFIIASLFLVSTVVGGIYITPLMKENAQLKQELDKSDEELKENRIEVEKKNELIIGLKENREAVNRVAREKFGFCGSGERVYKFIDEDLVKKSTD